MSMSLEESRRCYPKTERERVFWDYVADADAFQRRQVAGWMLAVLRELGTDTPGDVFGIIDKLKGGCP